MSWKVLLLFEGLIFAPPIDAVGQVNKQAVTAQSKSALPHCPVMPEREIDPDVFLDWRGRRVYFCCEPCRQKFQETPEKFAAALARFQPDERDQRTSQRQRNFANDRLCAQSPSENQWSNRDSFAGPGSWLGRLHPVTLHLPIGALFAGALAEFLYARRKRAIFDHAARFCLWFAMISGLITATLGWCLGGFHWNDDNWILALHRWLGTATALLLVILVIVGERTTWRVAIERIIPRATGEQMTGPAFGERVNRLGVAERTSPRPFGARLSRPIAGRFAYQILLASTTLLIMAAGFFGGAMVWGLDHLGGDFFRVTQSARADDLPRTEGQ